MRIRREQLEIWLTEPENEHLEFKEAKNRFDFEKLVKYCAALANERGGRMIFGVSDKRPRKIVGSQAFSDDLENVKAGLVERLHLRIEVEALPLPEGRVVIFDVPSRPSGMPIQYKGAYWMRAGESLTAMTPDLLKRIFEETGPDFSAEICAEASFESLDPRAIALFRELWSKTTRNASIADLGDAQLLADAELVVDGGVTYAALILLGTPKALTRHLAQAEVIFEFRSTLGSTDYQQRKEYREGFFLFRDAVWETIDLRNDLRFYLDDGFVRPNIPSFNEDAVREAILNAVGHRDYRDAGSIFVRQFPNKLEIVSPGGFPDPVTPENLLWQQKPRNRRIVETFQRCGLIERSGQGANRIFESCIREGKKLPDFSWSSDREVYMTMFGEIDPGFVRFLNRAERSVGELDGQDLLVIDAVYRGEALSPRLATRADSLEHREVIVRAGDGWNLSPEIFEIKETNGKTKHMGNGGGKTATRVIVVVDLSRSSDIGAELEEIGGVDASVVLKQSIATMIREAANEAGIDWGKVSHESTGDGSFLVLEGARDAHAFAVALHSKAAEHNEGKTRELAQRHYRIGMVTGEVDLKTLSGAVFARAKRFESACITGEIVTDPATWKALPAGERSRYGDEETIAGKREESFIARRCRVVDPAPWDSNGDPEVSDESDEQDEPEEDEMIEQPIQIAESGDPRSRGVFGRDDLVRELTGILEKKPLLVLYGLPGAGKTKVVDEIRRSMKLDSHVVYATERMDFDDFFRQIAPRLGGKKEAAGAQLLATQLHRMRQWARKSDDFLLHVESAHLLLAVDGSGFRDRRFSEFFAELAAHVPQVRTVLEARRALGKAKLPEDLMTSRRVRGLKIPAIREFFASPQSSHQQTWELDETAARTIFERLGGRGKKEKKERGGALPLAVQLLAQVAEATSTAPAEVFERQPERFEKDVEEALFNDLWEHALSEKERHMLRLCALYRQEIPHQHEEALNNHLNDDSQQTFQVLVERCLVNDVRGEQKSYVLHRLIGDLTRKRIDERSSSVRADHGAIGEAWLKGLSTLYRTPNILAAAEAVHHVLTAERYDLFERKIGPLLDEDARHRLAQRSLALHQKGDTAANRRVLELLVTAEPESTKHRSFLANAIEKLDGRGADAAEDHYRAAYELGSGFAPNVNNWAHYLYVRKRPREALDIVEKAIERGHGDVHSVALQAKLLDELDESERASSIRRGQIDGGLLDPVFYNDEAHALRERSERREALDIVEKAINRGIGNEHSIALQAKLLDELGEYERASSIRREQIDSGSRFPSFYNDEAHALRELGERRKAKEILERAVASGIRNEVIDNLLRTLRRET